MLDIGWVTLHIKFKSLLRYFFLRLLHPLYLQSKITLKYSETVFSNSNVKYVRSINTSSEVIEKLRMHYLQGSHRSSFSIFTFIDIIATLSYQSKSLSLVKWCFSRESKTFVLQIRRFFLPTRNMTRINVGLALSYVKRKNTTYVPHGKLDGVVYQQKVRIPMGTNCSTKADLFLHCYLRDCM